MTRIPLIAVFLACASPGGAQVLETVIPGMVASPDCASHVELRNLSVRAVEVSLEGHDGSGALLAFDGQDGRIVRLDAGERRSFGFPAASGPSAGWVKVAERAGGARASPVVAISAAVECREGDLLQAVPRPAAFAMRNPWLDADTTDLPGAEVLIVNAAPHSAAVRACYSSGSLYSMPAEHGPGAGLQPVCSAVREKQLAPFAIARMPVALDGTTHLSLHTRGDAMVLQVERPLDGSSRIFTVDSSIHFGQEVHH